MVLTNRVYQPREYLQLVTGKKYTMEIYDNNDNNIQVIDKILEAEGLCLWNYPLKEIDHILEEQIDVVLVECSNYSEFFGRFISDFRWFEVPKEYMEVK